MGLGQKVLKAQSGDDEAFYQLISDRKEILYRTAFAYVKNKEDALDILQETVYRVYVSLKKLKEPEFFNTYVTRILINCAIDHIRKNKKEVSLEAVQNITMMKIQESKEGVMDLYSAVDRLQEKRKAIIILKYFQDMTLNEIAEVLQYPLGTVKTNLHRALKELRLDLGKEEI